MATSFTGVEIGEHLLYFPIIIQSNVLKLLIYISFRFEEHKNYVNCTRFNHFLYFLIEFTIYVYI